MSRERINWYDKTLLVVYAPTWTDRFFCALSILRAGNFVVNTKNVKVHPLVKYQSLIISKREPE